MADKATHQIVIFLIGENGAGKTWIADRMVSQHGWDARLSIAGLLRDMVTDPGVFGIPIKYYTDELKDLPMDFTVQIQEGHLRRVISWIAERIPPQLRAQMKNDIRKVGVSSFPRPVLKTPREFLQYVGFGVINKISSFTLGHPNLLPMLAYNTIVGVPGRFIFDDLRMKSQLDLAQDKFQFVYPVEVKTSLDKKKAVNKLGPQAKSQYAIEENGWTEIKPFFSIQNGKDVDALDPLIKSVIDAVMADVQTKIARGGVPPLPITAITAANEYIESKGPLGKAKGLDYVPPTTMKVGKAVFTKAKMDDRGQLTETPTPDNKIQTKYSKAKI